MSEAGLITIIVAVLGLAGSGSVWGYRQFKKEAPVRQQDATIANAEKSVQMAIAVATAANTNATAADNRTKTLSLELDTEKVERQKLDTRVYELEVLVRQQRTIIHIYDVAWDDLITRWPYHRQQDQPPARPVTGDTTHAT